MVVMVNHKGRARCQPAFKAAILARRPVSSMETTIERTRAEQGDYWANWPVSLRGRLVVARVTAVVGVPLDNTAAREDMAARAIHHSSMATVAAATHSRVMAGSMAISRGMEEVVVACSAA